MPKHTSIGPRKLIFGKSLSPALKRNKNAKEQAETLKNEIEKIAIETENKVLESRKNDFVNDTNNKIDEIVLSYNPKIGYEGAMEFERNLKIFLKNKKDIDPRDSGGVYIRNIADDLEDTQKMSSVLQLIISLIDKQTGLLLQ